ncbi:MAG TPA: hypothetical protein VM095_10965 [Pyrinomonadaceae bacterium]|nr:hypothetical protein [Pyrinomonadaceae bacterium]
MKAATKKATVKKVATKAAKESGKKALRDFGEVYDALCAILKPYEKKLRRKDYGENFYYLETKEPVYRGKPMCYGGVRLGKAYVSYYLMSVYMQADLMKSMSPDLKKRMQGKSCFNFTEVDPKLFAELKALTKAGSERFDKVDWAAFEQKMKKR